jgi:Transposase DDE domain
VPSQSGKGRYTAVEIKDKDASDTKLLPALVDATAENFKLNEVSADKGYGSLKNYKAIQYHGAVPTSPSMNSASTRFSGQKIHLPKKER